jgi:hypothetical protein
MSIQPEEHSTAKWRKSRASGGNGACIEVAQSGSFVLVRDSRDQLGARLRFNAAQWVELVERVKYGDTSLG